MSESGVEVQIGIREGGDLDLELLDQGELDAVVERLAADRDCVTYDQLLALLPEAEEHIELLDTLLDELGKIGVAVVEHRETEDEKAGQARKAKPTQATVDLEDIPTDDLLSLYMNQMAREPLLTFDQEVRLAQQIEKGHQAEREIAETDCTAEEYARLRAQVERGQAAREHLGRANTRLVVNIAKRYRGNGVPFLDLIQNGSVGLMRAVDRYDHHTGYRFATYASWWIRQAVVRSLDNHGRTIRIPVHTGERMRRMFKTAQRLEKENGERPTPEEIAAEMGEPLTKIRQLMHWAARPLSLEQPVGEENDTELGYFILDRGVDQPEELTDTNLLREVLEELLRELTPREARVLRLRYGLQDGRTRTLKQVAAKFGLSRERIRQIEREAFAKILLVAPEFRLRHFLESFG